MRVVVLFYFLVLAVLIFAEQLEEHRKSCGPSKPVYILNDKTWTTKPVLLENPGLDPIDWDDLVRKECEPKFTVIPLKSSKVIATSTSNPRQKELRKLLNKRMEQSWDDETFRMKFVTGNEIVNNKSVPVEILKMLLLDVDDIPTGCKTSQITASVNLASFDTIEMKQCEDIGEDLDGSYEFYDIPLIWTHFESENVTTFGLKEELCRKNTDILLCPRNALEVLPCSVNNIENCQKKHVKNDKESPSTSYVRQLPGGVAVYGTFQEQRDFYENDEPRKRSRIDHGLYYFSHSES